MVCRIVANKSEAIYSSDGISFYTDIDEWHSNADIKIVRDAYCQVERYYGRVQIQIHEKINGIEFIVRVAKAGRSHILCTCIFEAPSLSDEQAQGMAGGMEGAYRGMIGGLQKLFA